MITYNLSNGDTILFPVIPVPQELSSLTFENVKEITSNYKSPCAFAEKQPMLMKVIFNNKWFNILFSNYITIETIIEIAQKYESRQSFRDMSHSYSRIIHALGIEVNDIIFGESITHQFENLNSDYIINKVRFIYKNKADLYVNNRALYKRIVKEDLLYLYYPEDKRTADYWNETTCLEESKSFYRVEDFFRCSPEAFEMAQFNDWIKTYEWIRDRNKCPNFYWTKERIIKLIEKNQYKTRDEFRDKMPGAHKAAKKNGWLDELIPKFIPKKKWDETACYELAKTCHNISEMEEKSNKAAKYARKYGWVEQYTWFENYLDNLEDFRYCIYVYTDDIAAYIGLTRDYRLKERHREHNNKKNGKYDTVKSYFNSKNEELPQPIVLMSNLEPRDAQYYEAYYKDKYEQNGYIVLNKAATGSLGGGYFRHTKEECESIAKQYKTLTEFCNKEPNIYTAARVHKWLNDYTWLERQEQEIVTYEEAYEAAKKYKYIGDFAKQSQRQYNAAYKKNWLKDYTWLEYRGKRKDKKEYTYEECFEAAKQYQKAKSFYNHKTTLCKYSREMGWYDDYIWFVSVYRSWNFKRCEQTAHKYTTLKEFETNCYGGYHVALNEGWLKQFDWLK